MAKHIALIEDEPAIRENYKAFLSKQGYNISTYGSRPEALAGIDKQLPDMAVIDIGLQDEIEGGFDLCRELRQMAPHLPIIFLTARDSELDAISGLRLGADDYLTKPFSPRELVARINSLLRRNQAVVSEDILEAGELSLDPASHRVSIANTPVEIGPTEYRLLAFFLSHQERVYSRDQILDHVWGGNVYMDERTVDVHIRRLRKAISLEGHDRFVQTVRGAGYRFSTKGVELNTA